ncbi:MAG TPA: amidohydrolase family protein [Actinomycetales bacterium]|nr:amidohydrolase family protein [Actinomycetales bacterium]
MTASQKFSIENGSPVHALRGALIAPDQLIANALLVVEGERIAWIGSVAEAEQAGYASALQSARVIPADNYLLPGLVDAHCHGGGGASFPDATSADEARVAADEHLRHGTTSLIASLVTADRETLLARVATLTELCETGDLAGIHLEGPFLSKIRCGAQNPEHMQVPDADLVRAVGERARGYFATMTIAPELDGMLGEDGVIAALADAGALPSIGHTDAAYEIVEEAIALCVEKLGTWQARAPLPTATHLFNGMRPLHHRDPGPIAACLAGAAKQNIIVELIADGTHLAPATVRSVFEMLDPDSIMLVTDAMAAAGMPDGEYDLGPVRVRVADGVARLVDGDAIAGGTAHLLDVVRSTVAAGVPLVDAVRSASFTPARALGLEEQVGALHAGLRADVLVADGDLVPQAVARAGRWVHSTE